MKLKHPFEFNKEKITEISIKRRPKVKDSLIAQKTTTNDADAEILLIANLAEVEPALVEELDMADYGVLQKEFNDFSS